MEEKLFCKECCKEISEETNNTYKGYCKSCYNERFNVSTTNLADKNNYQKASIIYFIIMFIISIIAGITIPADKYSDFNLYAMFTILFFDFITFFIFYMLATIIQELRNLQQK